MSESTRTTAVAGRVEPRHAAALKRYADYNGRTVSAVIAELVARAAPTLTLPSKN